MYVCVCARACACTHTYIFAYTRPALAHRVSRPRGTGSVGDSVGEGLNPKPQNSNPKPYTLKQGGEERSVSSAQEAAEKDTNEDKTSSISAEMGSRKFRCPNPNP